MVCGDDHDDHECDCDEADDDDGGDECVDGDNEYGDNADEDSDGEYQQTRGLALLQLMINNCCSQHSWGRQMAAT